MTTIETLLICVLLHVRPVQNFPAQEERKFFYTETNNHSKVIDTTEKSMPLQINNTTKFQTIHSDSNLLWLNRTIYYKIEPKEFSEYQKVEIKSVLQELMAETCVKFVECRMESICVHIHNSKSSSENIKYNGKILNLYLPLFHSYTKDSIKYGFLQALATWHKYISLHKADYINKIQTQVNISTGKESKHNLLELLHNYVRNQTFFKNLETVKTDSEISNNADQWKRIDGVDIMEINHLYNCSPIFNQKDDTKFNNINYSELSNIGDLFEPEHYEKINFSIKSDLKNITYNYVTLSVSEVILKMLNAAVKNHITKNNFTKSGNAMSKQIRKDKKVNDPTFEKNVWIKQHILANKSFIIESWNQLVDSLGNTVIDIALDILNIIYIVYKLLNAGMPENSTNTVKTTTEEDAISLYTTVDEIVILLKNNIYN